jgi:hypothetical protein
MSAMRGPEPALVMVRSGPASERGWLGLRLAMALGLAGADVTVWLCEDGAGWALPVDARPWLGGDPGRDLDGLVDDVGATVMVDAGALAGLGAAPSGCRRGVAVAEPGEFARRYGGSSLVLAV